MPLPVPAPPPEAPCLYRPYLSSQKGGTLIAAEVQDLQTHLQRMLSPDGYRPAACPRCGHPKMYAHDTRTRLSQLKGGPPVISIARHRCAHPACRARWQTLPGFVARHLQFGWRRVQDGCEGQPGRGDGRMPSTRTVRRWWTRLASSGARLVRLLRDAGQRVTASVGTRLELLEALGMPYWQLAAWLHSLLRGVRLM